jgi:hypothetical protein
MTDPLRPPSNALLANDEPLSDYLKRRERELVQQTAALRGMLIPKEQELANVRQAMEAVGIKRSYVEQLQPFLDQEQDEQVQPMHGLLHSESHPGILNSGPFPWELGNPLRMESLTIKEMILRALNEHFHLGATPSELSDYMRNAYGRDVDRNSISPQLTRLRDEGLVQNTNALTGKWEIVLRGTLEEAAAEIERKNVNALTPNPRAKRWYGEPPKKD